MSLTIGKMRGLQQLSDERGILAMCAMDHRGSLARMIVPSAHRGYEEAGRSVGAERGRA